MRYNFRSMKMLKFHHEFWFCISLTYIFQQFFKAFFSHLTIELFNQFIREKKKVMRFLWEFVLFIITFFPSFTHTQLHVACLRYAWQRRAKSSAFSYETCTLFYFIRGGLCQILCKMGEIFSL